MQIYGDRLIHMAVALNFGLLENISYILLALALAGYDIRRNIKKIIFFGVAMSITTTITMYLPPSARTFFNIILWLAGIKYFFGLSLGRSFLVFCLFLGLAIINNFVFAFVVLKILGVGPEYIISKPLYYFLYPFVFFTVFSLLTLVCLRKRWRIPEHLSNTGIKIGLLLIPVFQLSMLIYILNTTIEQFGTFFHVFIFLSLFIGLFTLWKLLQTAGREAVVEAQEQVVGEMQDRIMAIRTQRHDFINNVLVLSVLVRERRLEELKLNINAIIKDIAQDTSNLR